MKLSSSIFVLGLVIGCAPLGEEAFDETSQISQLTRNELSCEDWDDQRVANVKTMLPQGFVRNFPTSSEEALDNAISGIPDKYLEWLVALYNERKFQGIIGSPGMNGGMTTLGQIPISIQNGTTSRMINFALQHEIGHAIYPLYAYDENYGQRFRRELSENAWSQRANPNLHPYPKSYLQQNRRDIYTEEYWAEAFNSYYCSPETEHLVRQHFPSTYALLENYLEPPVWRSAQDEAPHSIAILIEDSSSLGWTLYVAGNSDVENAVICGGIQSNCDGSGNERWQLSFAYEKETRKIFKTQTQLPRTEQNRFTIEMRSANGEIDTRAFRLEKIGSI